jgi:hypothetical protein
MMKRIFKFIYLICALELITGCISKNDQSTQTEEIEIHFNGSFNGQKVRCLINDRNIFTKKLTRSPTLGVAHIEKVLVSGSQFNLKVNIDGFSYSYDLPISTGQYIDIRIQNQEIHEGEEIPFVIYLLQDKERPLYR